MRILLGGQVDLGFLALTQALQPARNGRLRLLGVTSLKRLPIVPEVPTIDESGVPGYNVAGWFGIVAPAGTPKPIVDKVYQALVIIASDTARERRKRI
jgi:tripartite-type tricarboxylate transporter receptor subunit TctC